MPYQIVAFLWRKPTLTPTEFKNHYETQHMPLLTELMGPAMCARHTRHYITRTLTEAASDPTLTSETISSNINAKYPTTAYAGDGSKIDYDVYSEIEFEDLEKFAAFAMRLQELEKDGRLQEDEDRFLLMQKRIVVAVEEPYVTLRPSS